MDLIDDTQAPKQLPAGQKLPPLLPLTPRYEKSSHKVYFEAIEEALDGPNADDIRNIALTGGYGVGKSSILQKVAEKHKDKVVQVSLSTLGSKGDRSEQSDPALSKTNLIQKEIVKQLLYREESVKMPGSRFRRIGRFKKARATGFALLLALLLTAIFYLGGWSDKLAILAQPINVGLWIHAILFAIFGVVIFATLALFHNRVQIRQVKIADTDISLAGDASTSYFDQYLDEIVYFFDVTKRDIVIFEDIDRFDDARIFETLRALNTLLNRTGQLKARRIRFIYAIKDSIFVKLGRLVAKDSGDEPDEDSVNDVVAVEVERANRTKFFDLVIPVVPFITHRNARNLMDGVLKDVDGKISPELIDLAARYLTDMRLIKNVRNEFIIFKDKVLKSDDGDALDLSDDALFAMMLYKSTHLADFEKVKAGTSKLDDLYADYREIVSRAEQALTAETRQARRQLANLNTADARSEELGDALIAYAERMARHMGTPTPVTSTVALAGQVRTDDIRTPEFWRSFADSDGQLEVSFVARSGGQRGQFTITKADGIEIFGSELASSTAWDAKNRQGLQERIDKALKQRVALSHSDMNFLVEHDDYTNADGKPFRELANALLESELARQLVAGGYIGRDFTLYTSTYYSGRVSTHAQNVLMHNVDRNVMDISYALEPGEVEAIVGERGETVMREHGMYNASVLDYLLAPRAPDEAQGVFAERDRLANILVRALIANGDDESTFFDAYFSSGGQQSTLVRKLAERWNRVFDFLIERSELEDTTQVELFSAALESMSSQVDYKVSVGSVRPFIEAHFAELPVLAADSTGAEAADRIANLFAKMSVHLPGLEHLSNETRRAIVATNSYAITRANLAFVVGGDDIALDEIQTRDENTYKYVLGDLGAYLTALHELDPASLTVANPDILPAIVGNVVEADLERLPAVLDGAVQGATVANLSTVPSAAWAALADRKQFPTTTGNVTAYIATIGEIDAHLGNLLIVAGGIDVPDGVDQPVLKTLAGQILSAQSNVADPAVRTALVVSLGLDSWLPATAVPSEKGTLIGLLIESEIIQDDAASFALALAQDWPTREFAISKSNAFPDFMTPAEAPITDVASLMRSSSISDKVKDVIVDRADEFVPTDQRTALEGLAYYVAKKSQPLPVPLVTSMASAGVTAAVVIQLLKPLLPQLNESQLVPILTSLGGSYGLATARNGKHPKLPNTPADLALVERLEVLDLASTHSISGNNIKVNMKK